MLTKNKGANSGLSVEELKKQASQAAIAKAVEVIKNGGTQAEAAEQARAVAREVLEKGTKEMQLAADKKKKKGGRLMSKFRRNKSKSKLPDSTASAADESKTTQGTKGTDSKNSKSLTVDDTDESGSTMSAYSSRSDSGGSSRSGYTDEYSNLSKPSIYTGNGYSREESVSLITDDRTDNSKSTINVMDLINMKNVMTAIDNALEEQDAKEEFKSGRKAWIDSILDCDICFLNADDDLSASTTKSNTSDVRSKVSLKSSMSNNTSNVKANKNSQVTPQPMPPIEETVMENENLDAPVENENVDAPAVNPPAMMEKGSVGNSPQGSALKKKASEDGAGVVKQSVSWAFSELYTMAQNSLTIADDSLVSAGAGPSMAQTLTHTNPPAVENVPKSPVTAGSATNKLSSSNSIKSTSSLKKRLLGEKSGKQSPTPPEQVLDQRQDSNLDWRSKVTDEAPQPNPRQLARQQQVYDPQRSNPSVFIPRRSELSQGEFINTGEMKQHPVPQMNVHPGYGYPQFPHGSVPAAAIPQNQQYYGYPLPPSSPYGSNPSSPRGAQPGSQHPSIVTRNNTSLSDADEDPGNDRYGGDEADMISDAAAKSKSQVDAAYGVLPAAPHGMMQHQHAQHYPPPQQYPPQQHYPQNYPPQQQQQQQQQYPPAPPQQQYQYSPASPQQQYQYSPAPPQPQQQYPHPQIDPNPSTAAYYEQHGSPATVSMIPGRQQFAA